MQWNVTQLVITTTIIIRKYILLATNKLENIVNGMEYMTLTLGKSHLTVTISQTNAV
jgi:hypothetical protein